MAFYITHYSPRNFFEAQELKLFPIPPLSPLSIESYSKSSASSCMEDEYIENSVDLLFSYQMEIFH